MVWNFLLAYCSLILAELLLTFSFSALFQWSKLMTIKAIMLPFHSIEIYPFKPYIHSISLLYHRKIQNQKKLGLILMILMKVTKVFAATQLSSLCYTWNYVSNFMKITDFYNMYIFLIINTIILLWLIRTKTDSKMWPSGYSILWYL